MTQLSNNRQYPDVGAPAPAIPFSGVLMKQIEDFYARLKAENRFFQMIDAGELTVDHVSVLLVNTHYLIYHTPQHMQLAIQGTRKSDCRFPDLVDYFSHHAEEEVGHHHWAEEDLERLDRRSRLDADSASVAPKMRELVSYVKSLITCDVALYLPYILYAEYISVVSVPETVVKLRDQCGIPLEALSVFTNHATLDQGHAGEDGAVIDAVVTKAPEYRDRFSKAIRIASQIYFDFLESIVAEPVTKREPSVAA